MNKASVKKQVNTPEISPSRFIFAHVGKYKVGLSFAIFWSIVYVVAPMQFQIITGALVNYLSGQTIISFYVLTLLVGVQFSL